MRLILILETLLLLLCLLSNFVTVEEQTIPLTAIKVGKVILLTV